MIKNASYYHNIFFRNYSIDTVLPEPCQKLESSEPYSIVSMSLVRDMEKSFVAFAKQVESEIDALPDDTLLFVMPEFGWRKTAPSIVFAFLEGMKAKLAAKRPDIVIIWGTLEFTLNGKFTNNAIVTYKNKLWFIPKTKVLAADRAQGLVPGVNPGAIQFPRFKLGVLVCADLWDNFLCLKLAEVQKADILAVPAWTATMKGFSESAKLEWHALAKTRSTSSHVITIVADHMRHFPKSDVANATIGFTPDNRRRNFPINLIEKEIVQMKPISIEDAKKRWDEKGLGQRPITRELLEETFGDLLKFP